MVGCPYLSHCRTNCYLLRLIVTGRSTSQDKITMQVFRQLIRSVVIRGEIMSEEQVIMFARTYGLTWMKQSQSLKPIWLLFRPLCKMTVQVSG
jgi:hypothetical protein